MQPVCEAGTLLGRRRPLLGRAGRRGSRTRWSEAQRERQRPAIEPSEALGRWHVDSAAPFGPGLRRLMWPAQVLLHTRLQVGGVLSVTTPDPCRATGLRNCTIQVSSACAVQRKSGDFWVSHGRLA
ncbi:hypothetical protein NDU88_010294 [Pleurodeles waltl]|uniref:Uncharacterized protein n=1 Tax=Pleurodeles waltl TaxID=8319 RepID=A0AAV7QWY8_PLEWA|nr:hypothetical protein NDU88_010294 [Pleurodeles waltl]